MATSKSKSTRNLQLVTKGRAKRPSQEQIRKALEAAGLTASQADDAAIYASHRVRTDATTSEPEFWTMRTIVLAVIAHLEKQGVFVDSLPSHKLQSVVAGLMEEWDDLIPAGSRIGGVA